MEVMQLETAILENAASQGLWAIIATFLIIYIVKSNEKRDAKQVEREEKYQELLTNLTEKFSLLVQIQEEVKNVKTLIQHEVTYPEETNNKNDPAMKNTGI